MAASFGKYAASTTPSIDFYNNVLTGQLTNAGWTYVEQIAAISTGLSRRGELWLNPGNDLYVWFDVLDTTNGSLNVFPHLGWNSGTKKVIRPMPVNNFYTSATPSADGSVGNGTEYTPYTLSTTGYGTMFFQFSGGYYFSGVNADTIVLGTRYQNINYSVVVSRFTSTATAFTDTYPFVVGCHYNSAAAYAGSSYHRGWGHFMTDPARASLAAVGAWTCSPYGPGGCPKPGPAVTSTQACDGFGYGIALGSPTSGSLPGRNHTLPVAMKAWLHSTYGSTSARSPGSLAGMRGYLDNFIVVPSNRTINANWTYGDVPIGWQWTYGGETYHNLGECLSGGDSGIGIPMLNLAVKESAF